MIDEYFFSLVGLIVLIGRLQPWRRFKGPPHNTFSDVVGDDVSIIIPCRNESSNIANLLTSLEALEKPKPEVIVVDDSSTDDTFEIASRFAAVKVIKAPAKPSGWVGKSWACWQGAQIASGDLLLFTDADTIHLRESLTKARSYLKSRHADMISAPPFHRCENVFERFLGLFHLLPLIAACYRHVGNPKRLYAIGQYLLIRRSAYAAIGGHFKLASSLAEDIDMARAIVTNGLKYAVYPEANLYRVQMYDSFSEFLAGWKRLLRVGTKRVTLLSFIEITLIFQLFFSFSLITLIGLAVVAWAQTKNGAFSIWGALLAPVNLVLFAALTLAAGLETLLRRQVKWHGRSYVDL